WTGLTASLEGMAGLPLIGGVAAVALVAAASWLRLSPLRAGQSLPWAMAGAAVVFFATTGYAPAANGSTFAAQSRYVYIGILLFLPLLAWVADRTSRRPVPASAWILVLGWALAANLVVLTAFTHSMTTTA